MTNAVEQQDLDGDGRLDGMDAARPMVQGLVELKGKYWTQEKALTIGAWGHYASERVDDVDDLAPPPGSFDYDELRMLKSWSIGGHLVVPLTEKIWIRGEAFYGQNLADLRGGIGQSINTLTGDEIKSVGGWGELGAQPLTWLGVFAGAAIDDPLDRQVADGQRSRNMTAFGVLRFRPWKPLQIGLEYIYWVTEYEGFGRGDANRVNLWTAVHF